MVKIIDNTNLGYLISKIKAAFWPKTDVIQIGLDNTPISGSDNLVKSGGVYTALNSKQDTLVSGTNIKTINNESLLGSGNISIAGGTGSGEANVIEAITFNGTPATITNKTAAITATIPAAVTESTVSGWGFTKNVGTLITETDPVFSASAASGITSSDITNWNGKTSNTGTVTGVKINGTTNNPTSGVVDLGTVLTSETSLSKGTTTGSGNAVTDISVSGHQITLTKGSTFLTSETSLSKGTASGSGNVVTDISVSNHQITLTKGATVPVATSADAGKIPRITSGGAWEYVTPSAIYSGSGTPSNSTGNNDDIYLQTS